MTLSAHFTASEFERASGGRQLTAAQLSKAQRFCSTLLEPLRRATDWPIVVTSFVRASGSGAHRDGDAVDISYAGNDQVKLDTAFAWLATYSATDYGELIHERDHLHLTLPGFLGELGETLTEPREGIYELYVAPLAPLAFPLLGVLLAYLIGREILKS
jgi:hypothetical protein